MNQAQFRDALFPARNPEFSLGAVLKKCLAYLYRDLYIYTSAAAYCEPRFRFALKNMKYQRHNAIRELVAHALVANQDELRRKLRRRGFEATQATLSRDIHELRLPRAPAAMCCPTAMGTAPP